MKFKEYINERSVSAKDDLIEEAINLIKKDCKPYLKYFNPNKPLYRGVSIHSVKWKVKTNSNRGILGVKKVRKHRKSLWWEGSRAGAMLFKRINDWLDSNGHVRRDISVSATSNQHAARTFGADLSFFPIGRFNYSFVRFTDFHYLLDHQWKDIIDGNKKDPVTTNKNIKTAIDKGYEIWFDCKSYYVASPVLKKMIKKGIFDLHDIR